MVIRFYPAALLYSVKDTHDIIFYYYLAFIYKISYKI